jgi:hypothetical protein
MKQFEFPNGSILQAAHTLSGRPPAGEQHWKKINSSYLSFRIDEETG